MLIINQRRSASAVAVAFALGWSSLLATHGGGHNCQPLEEVVNAGECVSGPGGDIVRHKSGKLLDLSVEASYPGRIEDEFAYHEANPAKGSQFIVSNDFDIGDIAVVVDTNNTIITEEPNGTSIDFVRLIKQFYITHPDWYDFVLIWPNFNHAEASAHITIKNGIRGIHLDIQDDSAMFVTSRLEAYSFFRNYLGFPTDVNARIPNNNDTTMTLIAQEVGHRWGAFVHFDANPGSGVQDSADLLGRGLAHWCYFAHVPAVTSIAHSSSFEGNSWQDNLDGTFTTINTQGTGGYSDLDQYLMGFRPPTSVSDTFVFEIGGGVPLNCASTPYTPEIDGSPITVPGTRNDVSINDITRIEGLRDPDETQSPRKLRMAFILLAKDPASVDPADITRLDSIRAA